MKRLLNILFALGVLVISGCQVKEDLYSGNDEEVVFGSTMHQDFPETKTVFTGPSNGGINWSGGESIQIQALANGEIRSGHYTVSQSNVNRSGVTYASGTLFKWRQSQYTFYGFYPASIGSGFSYGNGVETLSNLSVSSSQNPAVDMTRLYMFARRQESQGNTVQLDFYPLVTTVGITVTNSKPDGITLSDIKLSSEGKNPAGTYSVSFNGNSPLADNASGWPSIAGSGVVSINGGMQLASKGSQTAYLFLVPQVYDAGTVTLSFKCGDKTYSKDLKTVFGVAQLQPAHKYHLGITIANDGDVVVTDLSNGGAQMILSILRNKETGWPSDVMKYCYEKLGYSQLPDNWYEKDTEFYKMYFGIWGPIIDKVHKFMDSGWDNAKERFNSADDSEHFTAEELDEIKAFLATVTSSGSIGSAEWKISADILATDFSWLPSLTTIDEIECVQGDNRPSITIENLDNLTSVNFKQYTKITISGCGGDQGISITMSDANNAAGSLTLKDIKVNQPTFDIGNQHPIGPVTLDNVSGVNTVKFGNATVVAISKCPDIKEIEALAGHSLTDFTVESCPSFEKFTIANAGAGLNNISLINTPKFEQGTATTQITGVRVTLNNCSNGLENGQVATITFPNTPKSEITVSRTNSPNVKVLDNENQEVQ